MVRRVYIAGPMTGLPEFNYPAFNAEAARLRALGYEVENPAENPAQESWEDYMRVSLRQLLLCDVIVLLPGWENSRGAVLELHVAKRLGMTSLGAGELAWIKVREVSHAG